MDKIISSFVDIVIEQKKLQLSAKEISIDEQLFNENILKLNADRITVTDFKSISDHFLSKYKERLNFKVTENFKTNADFLNSVKNDFNSDAYVQNYHILEKELWKIITIESNSKYKCSFGDYLKENNSDEIYSFIEAYSDVLTKLDLTENEIFENAIRQIEITQSEATYNLPLSKVLQGIKNRCKSDYKNGIKLLNKALKLSDNKENLVSAIVSGLYENKKLEFYESILKNLIQEETKLNSVLFGLSNVQEIEISDCDLFVKLISDYGKQEAYSTSTLSIVFSILKSRHTEYHDFCFKELNAAIENEQTAYYILNNLTYLDNYSTEKTEIIVKLVNQNYFTTERYINPISQVFWHLKEFESFKKIALGVIENKPFEKFIKPFQSYFHSVDAIELDKFIIELLIDNSANKRHTGIEIFDELSSHQPHRFSFNILDTPPQSQYKLWISLTEDFHEPKKRLKALLPLIDSKSSLVRESFLCKLEEVSEDYGGHVTQVLEENLDKNNTNHSFVIDRVKKYIEEYYKNNVDLKRPVLELNPYYTHFKLINKYNELFHKKMNQSVEKGARENSLLSILGTNTVQLSKGGGWRIGAKKEISQLGSVGASFVMPRSYFINPNEFELSKGFSLRKDWTDEEFLEINTILDNE